MKDRRVPGISLDEWGRAAWKFMHAVAFTMPDDPTPEERKRYGRFFAAVQEVLPCHKCSMELKQLYADRPFPLQGGRERVSKWLWDLHNQVNRRVGNRTVSWEEAVQEFLPPSMWGKVGEADMRPLEKSNEDDGEKEDRAWPLTLTVGIYVLVAVFLAFSVLLILYLVRNGKRRRG